MNSPEEIQKAALAAEIAGMEKMPEAPEAAADFESIESYAENAETSIDSQANDFAVENKVKENPDTFGLPEDAAREIRVEQKVDDELGRIEDEADEAAKTAKAEIEAIVKEEKSPAEDANKKEISPTETVAPKEKEEVPQRIDDDARYRKLTDDLSLQYLKEKDATWFYQNYSGEVAPSGYLLDRNGKETNFLPSQNIAVGYDKIKAQAKTEFEKMYPEDAKKYGGQFEIAKKDQPEAKFEQSSPLEVKQEAKNDMAPKPIEQIEMPPNDLQKAFQKMGIESRRIPIRGDDEFAEAIILSHKEIPAEKTVRIFRGVNHVDASLLTQTPYAMRMENRYGKVVVAESVKAEVETLASHPTYENLVAYVNKMRPIVSDAEGRRMDRDLLNIEDGILNGRSVRKELVFDQIKHGGGVADTGISPYVSASHDAVEAARYIGGEGALVVMDVPISQLENFGSDSSEARIKGQLDQKYITAILPKKIVKGVDREKLKQDVDKALASIAEAAPTPAMSEDEIRTLREKQSTEDEKQDSEQWKIDVELVRRKRAEALIRKFRDVKVDLPPRDASSAESSIDVYAKAKTDIFDYYADRMGKIGRGGRRVEDASFTDSTSSERKPFDREKITDMMLIKLRELVENLEDRAAERARNQNTV